MSKAHILIIEDNETSAMLMQEATKQALIGNEVYTLHNCEDALKFLNQEGDFKDQQRPHFILLDLKMPGMGGYEFLKIVKENPALKSIPVIVFSASEESEDIVKSYEMLASCYITKPVNLIKFKKVVSVISDFWLGVAKLPNLD